MTVMVNVALVFNSVQIKIHVMFMILNKLTCVKLAVVVAAAVRVCLLNLDYRIPVSPNCHGLSTVRIFPHTMYTLLETGATSVPVLINYWLLYRQ